MKRLTFDSVRFVKKVPLRLEFKILHVYYLKKSILYNACIKWTWEIRIDLSMYINHNCFVSFTILFITPRWLYRSSLRIIFKRGRFFFIQTEGFVIQYGKRIVVNIIECEIQAKKFTRSLGRRNHDDWYLFILHRVLNTRNTFNDLRENRGGHNDYLYLYYPYFFFFFF